MADSTAIRPGSDNQAADKLALFLKIFGGEVFAAFEEKNIMRDKHFKRTITSGKTAQFPMTGLMSASYHTVGSEITGQDGNFAEKTINVDDKLISDAFFADVDEAMSHFDYRQQITKECGMALANQYDRDVLICGVNGARAAHPVTGLPGGTQIDDAAMKTSSAVLASSMFAAAQQFEENDVPIGDACAIFAPAQYYLLAQDTNVINKDWDGSGSYAKGAVNMIAGIPLVKTNHLPTTLIAASPTGTNNDYSGDFTKTAGLVMTPNLVGSLELMGLSTGSDGYQERWQGTLVVAKMMVGYDYLVPTCGIELKVT
jgi:hypothetical protein